MSKLIVAISIAQATVSIISAIQHGQSFYKQTVDFMDSMQIQSGLTGKQKKAAVMDKMKEILLGENEDWERWKLALFSFIDLVKTTFNNFKNLFPKLEKPA